MNEMIDGIKPDRKYQVWKKSSEKWRPEWSGHFAPMPSTNIKIIVLGCIIYYKVGSWTFTYETTLRNIFKYLMTIFDRLFSNNLEIIHGTFKMTMLHFIGPINLKIGNIIIPQISWPSQSPDLSPNKNIRLLMNNKIQNRLYLIRHVKDLKNQLTRAWNEIPLFYIQTLYTSVPKRCREVLF